MMRGTAGGQLTEAAARILPAARSTGMVTFREKAAARGDRTGSGRHRGRIFSRLSRRGMASRAERRAAKSCRVFSGVNMNTMWLSS